MIRSGQSRRAVALAGINDCDAVDRGETIEDTSSAPARSPHRLPDHSERPKAQYNLDKPLPVRYGLWVWRHRATGDFGRSLMSTGFEVSRNWCQGPVADQTLQTRRDGPGDRPRRGHSVGRRPRPDGRTGGSIRHQHLRLVRTPLDSELRARRDPALPRRAAVGDGCPAAYRQRRLVRRVQVAARFLRQRSDSGRRPPISGCCAPISSPRCKTTSFAMARRRRACRHALDHVSPRAAPVAVLGHHRVRGQYRRPHRRLARRSRQIFNIPGIGTALVAAVLRQTINPSSSPSLLSSPWAFVVVNFFVDLFYGWLDPRE